MKAAPLNSMRPSRSDTDLRAPKRLSDGWVIGFGLAGLALIGYTLGFLSLGRSLWDALSIASSHVLPATLSGIFVWRLQQALRRQPIAKRWALHILLASGYGISWAAGLALIAWLFSPEVLPLLMNDILTWTALSGILVYAFLAATHAAIIHRRRALERDAAAARAELSALRARVEPHFLYNALESISGLIRQDPDAAEEAIARLGAALRRLLDQTGPEIKENPDQVIAFADELKFVRDTLFIEQLRMGDRLRIVEKIADETLDLAVPPLTLQPLVENAIEHGLSNCVTGGTLSIVARRDGTRLVLEVSDDGLGAEENKFKNAPGLGLDHLQKRLLAHFGDTVRFNIAATPGRGVSVQISIPAIEI